MSAEQQLEKEIREAIIFLRTENHTIPTETLNFIKEASLEKLRDSKPLLLTYCFDCWNRKGKTFTKEIQARDSEDAKLIFEGRYPELAYDEPFI